MQLRRWLGLLLLLVGCPKPDPELTCFRGDPSQAPIIEIVHRTEGGAFELTRGRVPLLIPPQGGKVLLVGVRAKNLDGCPLQISASLRDTCNNKLLALERRPVQLEAGDDGWAVPKSPLDLDNFSNLPGCPRSDNDRPINDQPYLLRITVTDQAGRTAEASQMIEPYCGAEPDQTMACLCECRSRFDREACLSPLPDAGIAPGACWDGGS